MMTDSKKSWVRPARAARPSEDRTQSTRPTMTTDTIVPDVSPAPAAPELPVAAIPEASCSHDAVPHAHVHDHDHDHDSGCCSTTPAATSGIVAPMTAGLEIAPTASGSCCESSSPTGECSPQTDADAGESTVDDAALIEALREVIDPELMINIVDLGLVYSINHTDRKAQVEMTLTSPACPAGPQIIMQSKMALEKVEGIDVADIKLVMSPPWTPARMTDEARDQLGIF